MKVFLSRFGTTSSCIYRQADNPPFTVELFAASFFGSSPEVVTFRSRASPHTSSLRRPVLNEAHEICTRFALSSEFAPGPHGGIG